MGIETLFSDIARANYKPTVQAVGLNSQGQYVDADGKVTTLATQPGWFQRALNPEADRVQELNLEGQEYPLQQQQNEAVQKQIYENRDRPALQAFFGNRYIPQADDINYGVNPTGAFSAKDLMDYGRQGLDYQHNILPAQSSQDVASAQNESTLAQNRKLLNVPQEQAENESTALSYDTGLTQARAPYIPYKAGMEGAQDINEMWRQQNVTPIANQSDANTAKFGLGTSEEQLQELPSAVAGMRAKSISDLYQREHPDVFSSPFNATVNPGQGTISPGVYVSPEFRAAYSIMNGEIPGLSTGQPTSVMGPLNRLLNIGAPTRPVINPLKQSGMDNQNNTNTTPPLPPPNAQAQGAGDDSGQQQQQKEQQQREQAQHPSKYLRGARGTIVRMPQLVGYHYEHGPHGIVVKVPDYQ